MDDEFPDGTALKTRRAQGTTFGRDEPALSRLFLCVVWRSRCNYSGLPPVASVEESLVGIFAVEAGASASDF
jgi:hypothetical protein